VSDEIGNKDEEISKLRRKNESLDRKCARMREYVKNLTSKCKEWEETYSEKENVSQTFQRKYKEAMSKITALNYQLNSTSLSVASSHCNDSKYSRKAIATDSSVVSQLKNNVGRKDEKIASLKRRLLERSVVDENAGTRS